MRAAAFTSVAVMAIGAYLLIASTVGIGPTWIGLGTLAIAVTMAIALVSADERATASH